MNCLGVPSVSRSTKKLFNFIVTFEFKLSFIKSKLSPIFKYFSSDWVVKFPYAEPMSKIISPIWTTIGPNFPTKPFLADIRFLNFEIPQPFFLSKVSAFAI